MAADRGVKRRFSCGSSDVRDAEKRALARSGRERKDDSRGYWTLNIIAAETNRPGDRLSHQKPLASTGEHGASNGHPEGFGEDEKAGIWVMDRGGDRGYLYRYLLPERLSFIIRARSDRTFLTDKRESALEAAESCPMLFHEYIAKEEAGEERPLRLEVGVRGSDFRPIRRAEPGRGARVRTGAADAADESPVDAEPEIDGMWSRPT